MSQFGNAVFSESELDRINTLLERKLATEELATRAGPGGSKNIIFLCVKIMWVCYDAVILLLINVQFVLLSFLFLFCIVFFFNCFSFSQYVPARLTYVESHKAIELANATFGSNGWSSSIMDITIDFVSVVSDLLLSPSLHIYIRGFIL